MTKPVLLIMEQIAPEPNWSNKFRICETMMTIDGPRTRVTDKSFPTIERARAYLDEVNGKET